MIPQTPSVLPSQNWQTDLANAIKNPEELLAQLGLTDRLVSINPVTLKQFPLRVPQSYINKMRHGDPLDPLLRQVFPLIDEAIDEQHFVTDPVGDQLAITSPGLLQKYNGRALLLTTGACAIHCRYCFRRHFPYNESNPLASQWQQTLSALQQDTAIDEVILSGGDPLALSDLKLSNMVTELEKIPHLKRLRIHTRLPVVLPNRINNDLLTWLNTTRFKVVMVIHANHSNELTSVEAVALKALADANVQLLNQSVLLKGINDTVTTLATLSEKLIEMGVLPYYLHLLDPVAGASHFDVSEETGIALISQLREKLSGYLVPRLVREQQGKTSKTIIC
jgi:EF-P beta-lysylation protein EpmB